MKIDIQRLRNLTTHRLHTNIADVYTAIEAITKEKGIMTHQIPSACRALDPWLRENIADDRFFDGKYDTSHVGEIDIPDMSKADRDSFFARCGKAWE